MNCSAAQGALFQFDPLEKLRMSEAVHARGLVVVGSERFSARAYYADVDAIWIDCSATDGESGGESFEVPFIPIWWRPMTDAEQRAYDDGEPFGDAACWIGRLEFQPPAD